MLVECKSLNMLLGHQEVHTDLIKNGSRVDLILSWDNELIQMSLTDARKEIEAILRGIIGGPEAGSLTKQTEKKQMQYVLNYLNNFCSVPHSAGIERELG